MSKIDYLTSKLAAKRHLPENFFDMLVGPPVYAFFSPEEVAYIRSIILKNRNDVKLNTLNGIMRSKGFARLSGGTNRIVYRHLEDPTFVLKVALDRVGLNDNNREFKNQQFLKPYVCKIFDSTPCGTMATVERVYPITSTEEFDAVIEEAFYLIATKLIGTHVAEDIGKNYFRNYGIRPGFGVVLLDYPYFYRIDEAKLFCSNVNPDTGERCTGMIDYDAGFNHLFCTKCGKRYFAVDLEDKNPHNDIIMNRGGKYPMKVVVVRGDQEIASPIRSSELMVNTNKKSKPATQTKMKVIVTGGKYSQTQPPKEEAKPEIVEETKTPEAEVPEVKVETPVEAEKVELTPEQISDINEQKEALEVEKEEIVKEVAKKASKPAPKKTTPKKEVKKEEKIEEPVPQPVEVVEKAEDPKTKTVDLRPNVAPSKDYTESDYDDLEMEDRPKVKKAKAAGKAKKAAGKSKAAKGITSNFIPEE